MERTDNRGRWWCGVVVAAAGLAGGCAGDSSAVTTDEPAAGLEPTTLTTVSATPVNTICPIGKHEITEAGGTHRFDDQVVGFCCEGCYDAWPAMSRAERAAKLAAVTPTR